MYFIKNNLVNNLQSYCFVLQTEKFFSNFLTTQPSLALEKDTISQSHRNDKKLFKGKKTLKNLTKKTSKVSKRKCLLKR